MRVDEESDVVVGEVEEPEVAEAPEGVLADGRDVGVRDVHLLQLGQRGEDRAEDEGVGLVLGRRDGQDLRGRDMAESGLRRRGGRTRGFGQRLSLDRPSTGDWKKSA